MKNLSVQPLSSVVFVRNLFQHRDREIQSFTKMENLPVKLISPDKEIQGVTEMKNFSVKLIYSVVSVLNLPHIIMKDIEAEYNALTQRIIKCTIEVHKNLSPGLMESVYEYCLEREMFWAGLNVQRQVLLPVVYKGEKLQKDFIIDSLVEDEIVLELKSIEVILPIHEAQFVTYLKLSGKKLGLLINFNVTKLTNGVRRKINGLINE